MPTKGTWTLGIKVPDAHELPNPGGLQFDDHRRPMFDAQEVFVLSPILRAMRPYRWTDDGILVMEPNDGFTVIGSEMQALENLAGVLVKKQPIQTSYPAGMDLSLVIRSANNQVEILSVTRIGSEIEIKYVMPWLRDMHKNFSGPNLPMRSYMGLALIPTGKLPPGKYHVSFTRVPYQLKEGEVAAELTPNQDEAAISQPFSFEIKEEL